MRRTRCAAAALLCALLASVAAGACGGSSPATAPSDPSVGKALPTVSGKSLAKKVVAVPGDFSGTPTVVLVAPSKASQADAEKWIAVLRPKKDVTFVEVALLSSLLPGPMQGFINGKMREGEPKDMWPRIVPLYKDAGVLKAFFGDHGDESTYVAVLDGGGVVRFFAAAPFSAPAARTVLAEYAKLSQ
jgi:hypothetical protein